jgi:hypothetical protein
MQMRTAATGPATGLNTGPMNKQQPETLHIATPASTIGLEFGIRSKNRASEKVCRISTQRRNGGETQGGHSLKRTPKGHRSEANRSKAIFAGKRGLGAHYIVLAVLARSRLCVEIFSGLGLNRLAREHRTFGCHLCHRQNLSRR